MGPESVFQNYSLTVKGAAEQVNSWGGGGGGVRPTCKTCPTRGVWGHAIPGKFLNLHALRLNLEPSGGI